MSIAAQANTEDSMKKTDKTFDGLRLGRRAFFGAVGVCSGAAATPTERPLTPWIEFLPNGDALINRHIGPILEAE